MGKIILVIFFAIVSFSCKQKADLQSKSVYDTLKDSLTYELSEIHKKGYINGFGVSIVNQEGILYEKGFGYSDLGSKKAYTEQTIQNIGSVSKTLIGIALMKAQEMGALHLDDPIDKYLPFEVVNPNHPKEKITIRHLATHSSSILDSDFYDSKAYILKDIQQNSDTGYKTLNEKFNAPDSKMPVLEFLQKMLSENGEWYNKEGFSKHKPGAIFEYSNVAATLAAAVLEIAVKQSYDKFTKDHILNPLKMNSSGWSFKNITLEKHSKLYADPDNEIPFYSLITYPDGGLITNISELSKYLIELMNGYSGKGVLLKNKSYEELFRPQLTVKNFIERDEEDDFDDEFNSGIFMGFTPRGYIGHTGGDPGIATYMFFNPRTMIGKILIINTSVRDSEGVEEFYSIWNTLGKFENKLNNEKKTIK